MSGGRTAVYQAYGAEGLLYVGVAEQWARRWVGHAWERPTLFAQVVRLEVTWYATRAAAERAERALIAAHQPPHNRAGIERTERPPLSLRWYLEVPRLAPRPAEVSREAIHPLRTVAAQLALAPKTVQNLLWQFKREFRPPRYGRDAQGRRIRLLSDVDVSKLVELAAFWHAAQGPVKGKIPLP